MRITVFSRSTCAPCKMLKAYLGHKGYDFEEHNIDDDPEARAEAYSLTGYSIVPVTVVEKDNGNKSVISGYNLSQLMNSLTSDIDYDSLVDPAEAFACEGCQ